MALSTAEQIQELIKDKKNILITFAKNSTADAVTSALALLLYLEKMGKVVDVVSDEFTLPKNLSFLKKADTIKPTFSHLQKFILILDVKDAGVDELSYDLKGQELRIYITPKQGFLTRDAVRTAQTNFRYDLIITVATADLESLGGLYTNNTELFYKTPLINIDHNPANERYGQINYLDVTASSTAEALYTLFKEWGEENIEETIADAILTGIIASSRSFKSDTVKPNTLATAGKLVSMGANRERIVENLFRTRTVSTLKLWGITLAHLQQDTATGLVWSAITREDFARSGAHEHDLVDMMDELLSNSPEAKTILLLHEHKTEAEENTVHGLLRTDKNNDCRQLLSSFNPDGDKTNATFIIKNTSLGQVETQVVEEIKRLLKK